MSEISRNRRYRILVVDDDPDVLDVMQRALEDEYDVLVAESGEKALELLRQGPADMLITDQRMPEMSGIHLLEQAKKINPDMVRIILTGYTDPADLIDAINRGEVWRYITKPWDLNDLLLTIRQGLENYQLRRDKERLVRELETRLDITAVLLDVGLQSSLARSADAIVKPLLENLPRLLDFDACAVVVGKGPGGGGVWLNCRRPLPRRLLLEIRRELIDAYRNRLGGDIDESSMLVEVTGDVAEEDDGNLAIASKVFQEFKWGGLPVGMLLLASTRADAFQADAHRLLDMLANQAAELIGGLRRQLGQERQRLDAMLKSLADGVIMVDENEQVAVINPAARRLLGIDDSEDVTTRYLKEALGFYPFELVKGWQASEGRSVREEVQLGDKLVHSIVSPVSQDGRVIGVAVVLRDVTEERRLMERKEEFISIVSHELRTPLTSIGGAIDLLLSNFAGPLNQKQKHYLSLARAGCEKMNMLVDELLDLRRLEQGRMKMDMRPMNLSSLVGQVTESFKAAALNKGVRLDISAGQKAQIMGDRNRLHQVLNNLLSNALKFVSEGGNIGVEVFTSSDMPGMVGVSVFNDGDEIPEQDHKRIFDKFEQAKSSRSGKVSGSGLGLAICKSIVEAHGGRIWVESGRGSGTRFIFTLPAKSSATEQPGMAGRPLPRFKGTPRLLVVDDDVAFTYVVKGYLMGCGFEVDIANDGAAAVHLCRERKPELIIMDIKMPSPDGLDTVEALKHDPKTRDIPVLVVSGACDDDLAAQAGTAGFMKKPLVMEELRERIERILLESTSAAKRLNILVVDDDPAIRDICREVLEGQGFATLEASSGKEAVELARNNRVDAVLLDLMLPDFDGFQVTEMLRRLHNTEDVPIIFISARGQTSDKVRALRLGADDYVVKPFDAMELGARVEAVINRKERETDASPTTRLPGSAALEREVSKRLAAGEKFYLCYLDLDNLKAYNDYYGYARADGVIRQTASIIRRAVETHGGENDFLAHIAGDDFVLITAPDRLEPIAAEVIGNFDRVIPLFYEPEDQQRGFIEAMDRFGQMRRFGIMTISLAAVLVEPEKYSSHSEISEAAAHLKLEAKKREGSVLVKG